MFVTPSGRWWWWAWSVWITPALGGLVWVSEKYDVWRKRKLRNAQKQEEKLFFLSMNTTNAEK